MPYAHDRLKGRRVVRLVSVDQEADLSIELQRGANRIGRQRDGNHIVLVSGEVSRSHAEIVVSDSTILMRDLGSSNGTFVNRQQVHEAELEAGDEIRFSEDFCFKLQIDMAMEQPEVVTLPPDAGPALRDPAGASSPTPGGELPRSPEEQRRNKGGLGASSLPGSAPSVPPQPPSLPAQALAPRPSPGEALAGQKTPASPRRLSPGADPSAQGDPGAMAALERERRQLAVLYQVSKRCMAAESFSELDRLLINVLERIVSFERGFITYQLPNGDWKLIMSPRGDHWERAIVRSLLQQSLKIKSPIVVLNSATDDRLGSPHGRTDSRLLLPLRSKTAAVGAVFLISNRVDAFEGPIVDFLSLFGDIAALAVVNCSRLETRRGNG